MVCLSTFQWSGLSYRGHLPARGTGRCNLAMGPEDMEKRTGDFFAW